MQLALESDEEHLLEVFRGQGLKVVEIPDNAPTPAETKERFKRYEKRARFINETTGYPREPELGYQEVYAKGIIGELHALRLKLHRLQNPMLLSSPASRV